jgi:Mg2+/Co2+ transporter CorB
LDAASGNRPATSLLESSMNGWPAGCLLAIFLLVVLSAFFAGTEAALANINRYRLRNLARTGNRSARHTEELLKQSDRLTSTILLCKTIANVGAASLSALLAMELGGGAALAIVTALLAIGIASFCEIAPKTYGALYPERFAFPAAWLYAVVIRVLFPVVWLVNIAANAVLRVVGVAPKAAASHLPTLDARRAQAADTDPIGPGSRQRILASLIDLESIAVEDIMIPRSEIANIDLDDDWDSILDLLRSTPHTRLPVCKGNLDNIVGILHMKKVAHGLAHGEMSRESLEGLAREREAYFVPEGTTLDLQLSNFQRDRRRIALVVDEYGDIQGLVTLEDILEEIVGEFTSDPATLHKGIHREADGSYVVSGTINVRVLNRALGWTLPTDGPRTLNGVILEYLEEIPEHGTSLKLGELSVEILQTADNAVKTARVRAVPDNSQTKESA